MTSSEPDSEPDEPIADDETGLSPDEPPRVVPFASAGPLQALRPEHPAPALAPAIPSPVRWALIASLGAALLSTTVALYVVTRHHDESEPRPEVEGRGATTAPTMAMDEPVATTVPVAAPAPQPRTASATEPMPEASPVAWPDTQLGALPPVGAAPEAMGQSVGSPRDGALLRPTQLPPGRGYVIRNPQTAWGTTNTIAHLRTAIAAVRARHPDLPQVLIGDISSRRGGPLTGHQSHQAGRDVDIGLLHRAQAEASPMVFVEGTRDNLDKRASYDLVAALAASADEPDGVELIVLDYNLQRVLRRAAAARGVPEAELEALFQFPHGPSSRHGLVRHMPAHRDHLHVRFKCPTDDAYCRDPLIGFGGMEAPEGQPSGPSGI